MWNTVLLAATLASTPATLPAALPAGSPNQPVETLALSRYLGQWHEVARLPMFFQRKCVSDTTATYGRREDGRLTVRNACRKSNGQIMDVEGVARTTPTAGALEVQFAPEWLPFGWADYWVIDLDPDYQWAVVGGPSRGALWILSRSPTMDPALLERLRQRAEARGYRLDKLLVAQQPQRIIRTTP